ncbi:MAG: CDC27 family protein [Paludibacter sp.]|nr:CDC27 family protein [Paludibacter sp.]
MNPTQIHSTYTSVLNYLSLGSLKNAFDKAGELVLELQMGTYADQLQELQQNYKFLLNYYIDDIEDPDRKTVYNKLISRLFILASELREELMMRNSSGFEYTQQRYFPHTRHYLSVKELFVSLNYYHSQTALIENLESTHALEIKRLRSNYETALNELFRTFWLNTHYSSDELEVFNEIVQPTHPGSLEKALLVSAVTLNLWRMFDQQKLMLLLDCCTVTDQHIKQRAMTGLCFVLSKYNKFLPYFPALRNRLVLLADDNNNIENFKNIIIQIISTVETDKISKKLREEILPEVMKISPLIKDKMEAENLLKSDDWEEGNPEWQDILENSGVSDKLQELSELQLEGADVYMSTFSMLKGFPFFNEFTNWLLPFDVRTTAVSELFANKDKSVLSLFVGNYNMCNSDKYSFCLSILQMPEKQRNMMQQSFNMESEQMEEMAKDEALLKPNLVAKNISKQYIQDLFRLFKLHPQHNDFSDMFVPALLMHRSYLFGILAANGDIKAEIAEYYFSKNHYKQALDLYEELLKEEEPTAALYQKAAYCYQQTSQLQSALDAYLKADIIQPDDLWTIRKIALCYRLLGQFAKALEFYQHADFLKPDNKSTIMNIGQCLVELGKYKEALNYYHKLEDDQNSELKVERAIVWCAFVSGDLAQAAYYSQKIIESTPKTQDLLNAGHIAWCDGKKTIAIDYYIRCMESLHFNTDVFTDLIHEDKIHLINNGVHPDDYHLMIDEVLYRTDTKK